ncbi:hypothetical protein FOA52_001123 [Chlamydomonas sp. UWO 241]|nr:hypothetical protein FOA52_001123 [Chlamydomonas sp. UWO 241]
MHAAAPAVRPRCPRRSHAYTTIVAAATGSSGTWHQPWGPKINHPATYTDDPPFAAFKHLNTAWPELWVHRELGDDHGNGSGSWSGSSATTGSSSSSSSSSDGPDPAPLVDMHGAGGGRGGRGGRTQGRGLRVPGRPQKAHGTDAGRRRVTPTMMAQLFPPAAGAAAGGAAVAAGQAADGSGDGGGASNSSRAGVGSTASSTSAIDSATTTLASASASTNSAPSSAPTTSASASSSASGGPRARAFHRFCAALARRTAVDVKELLEAAEFYERTRGRMRTGVVVDVACGHGLVGAMFAVLEPRVQHVLLLDRSRPPSFDAVLAAAAEVSVEGAAKLTFVEADLRGVAEACASSMRAEGALRGGEGIGQRSVGVGDGGGSGSSEGSGSSAEGSGSGSGECSGERAVADTLLAAAASPEGLSLVAVHACGGLTDVTLSLAVSLHARVAAMPCCYGGTATTKSAGGPAAAAGGGPGGGGRGRGVPLGVRRALGVSLSADVARSFNLAAQGYDVDWSAVPMRITPMNRILIGEPRAQLP